LVARVVAPLVVDAFKVVDVDHHIDHRIGVLRNVAAEAETVAHAGELVADGGLAQMLDLDLAQDDRVAALVLPLDDHAADEIGAQIDDDHEGYINIIITVAHDGGVPAVEHRQQHRGENQKQRDKAGQLPVAVDRREGDGRDAAHVYDDERVVEEAEGQAHEREGKRDEIVPQVAAELRQPAEPVGRGVERRVDKRGDDQIAQIIAEGGRFDHVGRAQDEGKEQLDQDGDGAQHLHGLKVRAAPLVLEMRGFFIVDSVQLTQMFQLSHGVFPLCRVSGVRMCG
jgi:hypothetical protein